jgi:hypothetical protein
MHLCFFPSGNRKVPMFTLLEDGLFGSLSSARVKPLSETSVRTELTTVHQNLPQSCKMSSMTPFLWPSLLARLQLRRNLT